MNLFQKFFSPVDMTEGRPWEDILIFTVPMLLGNIAQQLYSTVDVYKRQDIGGSFVK